jgi:two-component system, OmpR family, sensor histidine kinase KdpD
MDQKTTDAAWARRIPRFVASICAVTLITAVARSAMQVNATTIGFAFLLLVLVVASTWGYIEALLTSVAAGLAFNFFFLPPFGTFTIADPQNWVALFSFLSTALIASRLSTEAKRRAGYAVERQRDVERLYAFSRAILLISSADPFPAQLARKLAEIFQLESVVVYDRRDGQFHRAGPADFRGSDERLRDAALNGSSFSDTDPPWTITAVRLGSDPIASLGLQGASMPDSVLLGVANLVAIGLERARAEDLAHQIEVVHRSEHLRTTLIDAMAHELKTPLTLIKAATTALLAAPEQPLADPAELLKIADEEADHLTKLIGDAVEMARLDTTHIDIQPEVTDIADTVREVLSSMEIAIDHRPMELHFDAALPPFSFDRRLVKLAVKQLLDNALKYSSPGTPVEVRVHGLQNLVTVEITDHGAGIPAHEQVRIFDRFYRSPSVQQTIPGSGLGLTIAYNIARAHKGDLTVTSRPGESTFRLALPVPQRESVP